MEEQTYKYFCDKCNYGTNTKFNFERHLKSNSHLGLPKQKICRELVRYDCDLCDFHTKYKGDWEDHLKTKKHKDAYAWANMNILQKAYVYKKKERELIRKHDYICRKSDRCKAHKEKQSADMRAIAKERKNLKINGQDWENTIFNILETLRLTWEYLPSSARYRCFTIFKNKVQDYKERKNIQSFWRCRKKNIILIERKKPPEPPPIKREWSDYMMSVTNYDRNTGEVIGGGYIPRPPLRWDWSYHDNKYIYPIYNSHKNIWTYPHQ